MKEPAKLVIYESAMCCSSGVCGPSPNSSLIDLQGILDEVSKMGITIERYSITQNFKKFMENPKIIKLIQEQQLKALPATVLNGNIIKVGSYPTRDELLASLNSAGKTKESPTAKTNTAVPEECCSGKDSCDIHCSPIHGSNCSAENRNSCCS